MGYKSLLQTSKQQTINDQKVLESKLKLAEEDITQLKKDRDDEKKHLQDQLTVALTEGKKS